MARRPRVQRRSIDLRLLAAGLVALGFALSAASCAELPELARGVCGNAVIDRELGEECDGSTAALREACLATFEGEASSPCESPCGAPGTAHACQLLWNEETSCPIGFGAGYDGRCRRPSGCFEAEPIASFGTASLEGDSGDFNGDGVDDLLLVSNVGIPTVTLFQPGGTPLDSIALPFGLAAAGALTSAIGSDTTSDIVIPAGPTLVTIVGPDLTPKAYTPFPALKPDARAFSLPLGPGQMVADVPPGFELPLLMVDADSPSVAVEFHALDAARYQLEPGPLVFSGLATSSLVSDPVFADLLRGTGQDGIEVVVATEDEVLIGTINDGTVVAAPPLLPGEKILGLHAAPGHPETEVAVITAGTGLPPAYSFLLPTDPLTFSARVPLPTNAPPATILALGYINSDDVLDIVTTTQVLLANPSATPPASYLVGAVSPPGPWTTVRLVHVNGDDRLDVVAVPPGNLVTVLSLGSEFAMNSTYFTLPGPGIALEPSDIDGDGVSDLVVATSLSPLQPVCNTENDIVALYGRSVGPPEDPVVIGRLRGVTSLRSTRLYLSAVQDGVEDLVVQVCGSGATDEFLGVFLGSTTRAVYAPYSPYVGDFDERQNIERAVVGKFGTPSDGAEDGHLDVAIVAVIQTQDGFQRELRVLPAVQEARFPTPGRGVLLGEPATDPAALQVHLADLAKGNLFEASPTDELAVVHVRGGASLAATLDVIMQDAAGAITVASHPIPVPEIWGPSPVLARVRLFDYDGDEDLDALVALAQLDQIQGVTSLFVNDGAAFALTPFVLSEAQFGLVFDAKNLDRPTCVEGDIVPCDPNRAVLYATFTALLRCSYGATTGCTNVSPHAGVAAIVGDYDDDGVEDLALLGGNAKILRQCPMSEVASGECGPDSCRDPQAQ